MRSSIFDSILLLILLGLVAIIAGPLVTADDPPPPSCDNACRERRPFKNISTGSSYYCQESTCYYCKNTNGICYAVGIDPATAPCAKSGTPQLWAPVTLSTICGAAPTTQYVECLPPDYALMFLTPVPDNPNANENFVWICDTSPNR